MGDPVFNRFLEKQAAWVEAAVGPPGAFSP